MEVIEAPSGDMAIICRDANAFRRNILPILRDQIDMDARYKAGISLIELYGRRIHIIGCHDARSEGKLRGCTLQAALVDEASLIPEASWIILLQRIAMNGGRVFATTNPDSPMHWLKTGYIDNNLDSITFSFGLLDNPKLTLEEREFLERQHTGVWYRRFIKGEWCLAEGAIFDFFDEKIHTIQRPPAAAKFYLVGVDVGFTNPTGFTLIGYNDDVSPQIWVEDEYYWNSKKMERQKTDAEYASDLFKFIEGRNVSFIFVDPAAASFKVEIRRAGIRQIPIRDAINDVSEGIKTLSSFMSMGDLKIVRTCRNLVGEIQGYCWDPKIAEKGEDAPIKRADHLLDSLRYAVFSYFGERRELGSQPLSMEGCRTLGYRDKGLHDPNEFFGNAKTYISNHFDPRQCRF